MPSPPSHTGDNPGKPKNGGSYQQEMPMLGYLCTATTRLITGLGEFIYPTFCFECRQPVVGGSLPLCPSCLSRLEPARLRDMNARLSEQPYNLLDGIFALWMYDTEGALQPVLHALKYQNRPQYGPILGREMGKALRCSIRNHALWTDVPDIIVPIPMTRLKRLHRGYNQAELLAQGMAPVLDRPTEAELLHRIHHRSSQTKLSPEERLANVEKAFQVVPDPNLEGQSILLVDDLMTTGATLIAAARCLQAVQPGAIFGCTLAFTRR